MSSQATGTGQDPKGASAGPPPAPAQTSVQTSPPTSPTRPNSALSKPSGRSPKPRKRAKVSFAQEVVAKDGRGDGNGVTIKEEHGVFLGPLLGRMVMPSSEDETEGGDDDAGGESDGSLGGSAGAAGEPARPSSGPTISFAADALMDEKISREESARGILKPVESGRGRFGDPRVEYDNLVVRMGLLKCGHRYRATVPIPDYWRQRDNESSKEADKEGQAEPGPAFDPQPHDSHAVHVRVVEDSLDEDLRGEVRPKHADEDMNGEDASDSCASACITLSARRRGPYRGRFVLELTRHPGDRIESAGTGDVDTTPERCLMSLQVDATIMGKDMGTPKLRNGVVCLGKIVGYDSDDETEWQGFD
ncbi:hypothetical protein ACHAWF_015248 [Thalassiosira exigua]